MLAKSSFVAGSGARITAIHITLTIATLIAIHTMAGATRTMATIAPIGTIRYMATMVHAIVGGIGGSLPHPLWCYRVHTFESWDSQD